MTTKTITIMEDAYVLLRQRKGRDESFSDVIRKLSMQKKGDIWKYYGAWSDMTDREADEMKKAIEEHDRKSTKELMRRSDEMP